jgi:hypothetical protein
VCYMPYLIHPPSLELDNSNYIWQRVQLTKLIITQFSLPSYYFIPLESKHSQTHSVYALPLMSENKFHAHTKYYTFVQSMTEIPDGYWTEISNEWKDAFN